MAEAPLPPSAIDSHAHVFERDMPLAPQRRHAPTCDALLDEYLALLDANGISHGVLVQPSFLGTDNRYLLDALNRQPARLRAVVMLDPATTEDDLRALAGRGVTGVRLNLVGLPLPDLSAPLWQRFLARLRALDWHLELHREARDLPALLDAALPAGCRIVIDHFGRPDAQLGTADAGFTDLLRRADTGRVWVKLSAAYRNARSARVPAAERTAALSARDADDARACAGALLRAFGPQRLLWGSDWPHTQHQELIDFASSRALLDDWVPDPTQRRHILVDTPAELFGLH